MLGVVYLVIVLIVYVIPQSLGSRGDVFGMRSYIRDLSEANLLLVCIVLAIIGIICGMIVFRGQRFACFMMLTCGLCAGLVRAWFYDRAWPQWAPYGEVSINIAVILIIYCACLVAHVHCTCFPITLITAVSISVCGIIQLLPALAQLLAESFNSSYLRDITSFSERQFFVYAGGTTLKDSQRIMGFLQTPNDFAAICIASWPTFLYMTRGQRNRGMCLIGASLIPCMFVIGILYSYSRAAYLGLFMQLLYVLVLRKQFNWIKSLGLAMMVALCIFCIMFDSRISHRTAEIAAFDDSAIANRLQVFSTAVDLFFEEPFAGPGAGVFGTLYNRCYKRPDFRHPMTGAHSTIVSLLLIVGACGIFFIVVLVTAGQPRRFWLSQELFVRLALIGIMPYMATEYCGYAPIVTVVLFWLLVCMLYSSASIGFVESKRSVIVMWLVAFLWLGGLLHTLPSPESRYSSGVDRILYRLGGDVSYYVKDFNTGMEWSKRDRRLYPGGFLPSIVIALTSDVYKTTGDCVIPPKLNGSGIIDHLPDRPYDMACKNCEFLMLQCADVSAANSLINSIGAAKLQNYAYSLDMPFLIPRFYNPISLQNGSTNVKYHEFGAQISSRAASQLICKLVDEMEDSTAKEALRIHSRGWGMTRHLRPIISCYNMLDSGPSRLAEVTYVVGYKERWVACILGKNVINSRGVIDDRGSRALAEIGWRTHLLLVNR